MVIQTMDSHGDQLLFLSSWCLMLENPSGKTIGPTNSENHFGISFRKTTLAKHCGKHNLKTLSENKFEKHIWKLWTTTLGIILQSRSGEPCWKIHLEDTLGNPIWKQNLPKQCEKSLWKVMRESNARNPIWNTASLEQLGKQSGRNHASTILENRFGKCSWNSIYERPLWITTFESQCWKPTWGTNMDNHWRELAWRTMSEIWFGKPFWQIILAKRLGNPFWEIALGNYCDTDLEHYVGRWKLENQFPEGCSS